MTLSNRELLEELASFYSWRMEAYLDDGCDYKQFRDQYAHGGYPESSGCWEVLFTNGMEHMWFHNLGNRHVNVMTEVTWRHRHGQSITAQAVAKAFGLPTLWASLAMQELVSAYRKFRDNKLLAAYMIEHTANFMIADGIDRDWETHSVGRPNAFATA